MTKGKINFNLLSRRAVFLILVIIGVITTIYVVSTSNRSENKSFKQTENGESQANEQNSPNFNSETRVYTSPEVLGADRVLKKFSFNLPANWEIENERTDKQLYLTLTNGDTSISISEYGEGGKCVFPEYKNSGESGYVALNNHRNLVTGFGEYRVGKRFDTVNKDFTFNLCRRVEGSDSFTNSPWNFGTKIGYVSYSIKADANEDYDRDKVIEVETLLKSIRIIEVSN